MIIVIDGVGLTDVDEVEDVAFGDGAVVPGFDELVFRGAVGELVEGGVVAVGCCLAVLPPGVAFADAGAGGGESQMRIVIWTFMSGCRLRRYRW
ncbi:hypothetical protein AB0929_05870 [Streptomyces massasporeus]|uniref:hypothetical protein n=1 Tax=Streptomyces massasporeus TaxID=67324 RepID=UPI00345656E2